MLELPFPTPEALEVLAGQPLPARLFDLEVRDVERWRLAGPFPERLDGRPWRDPSPAGALLAAQLEADAAGQAWTTEAMHCAARETGRFVLEHEAQPSEGLRRFIRGRCGASVSELRFGWVGGRVPPEIDEAQLVAAWSQGLERTIEAHLGPGTRALGIWVGRDGERAIAVVASGLQQARIVPVRTVPDRDGGLELEGELRAPTRAVEALITRGPLQVAPCERDAEVALPRFHFRCRPDPTDRIAWVGLSLLPPERLIASTALELLLRPQGDEVAVYERPSIGSPRPADDAGDAATGFVELLNRVRSEAGLAPLTPDPAQSRIAASLAPHFFEALLGRTDRSVADLVVLGMMAGWKVQGVVASGQFTAAWVTGSRDLDHLLAEALDQPAGRAALLSPQAERVAVGPVVERHEDEPALAIVVGTYALIDAEEHARLAGQVLDRLTAVRRAQGLEAPQRLIEVDGLAMDAAGSLGSGADARLVLDELLGDSGAELGRSVSGWLLESTRLEDLSFPAELVARPEVGVAIGVSAYRPAGQAWGRHVVMIVAADPGRPI